MVPFCPAGEEDSMSVKYMWLKKGQEKRCYCGYYFKLVDLPNIDD